VRAPCRGQGAQLADRTPCAVVFGLRRGPKRAEQLASEPQLGLVRGAHQPSVLLLGRKRRKPSAKGRAVFPLRGASVVVPSLSRLVSASTRSKSLSKSRSCTMRYFSNSLSACCFA